MDSERQRYFQLVIVHSTNDSPEKRDAVGAFWSSRFPLALITNIPFLTKDPAWGSTGLSERALGLLKEVEKGRKYRASFGPKRIIPYVFLCHELGGPLVKQALLLAQKDKRYGYLAFETALVVFYNCPGSREKVASWQRVTQKLLSNSETGSCQPSRLLHELPTALEDVSRRFSGIEAHYTILIGSDDEASNDDMWMPSADNRITEQISVKIRLTLERKLRSLSQELLTFVTTLSAMDQNNYQLQLLEPSTLLLQEIVKHSSYRAWSDFCPKSPNILSIYGLHDYAIARLASALFIQFQVSAERPALATFTFSKSDARTQITSTFYASLCRQLLLQDPLSYPRVSSMAGLIERDWIFSHKTIRNLLLQILKAFMPRPVVIIIHGTPNYSSSFVKDLLVLVNEYKQLAIGALKIIFMDKQHPDESLCQYPHSCCIDLGNLDQHMPFLKEFAQQKANSVVKNNDHLRKHCDEIFEILFSEPYDVDRIALAANLMMLELEGTPSTRAADALRSLPKTLEDMYSTALERCRSKYGMPLDSLWMWILHPARPLTLGALAIAIAISSSQHTNLRDCELEISFQIARDLQYLNGTLIKISDLQVLPIFPTLDRTTEEAKNENEFIILGKCLEYLRVILEFVGPGKGKVEELHDGGLNCDFIDYAAVEWPHHYIRTKTDSKLNLVKEFFNDEDSIKLWFGLYKLYMGPSADKIPKLDSILKIACWFGLGDLTEHIVQELLLRKDGHESELSESLDIAAARGQENTVVLLLKAGARSKNAMSLAAGGGFMGIMQKLYETDANLIHDKNIYGRSPLMMATLNGDENIASFLIEHGAKCDILTQNGTMPLHLATSIGHTGIVNLLITKTANVHTLSAKGCNALHLAAAGGFDDISKILISAGVRVNQKNNDGMTALHLAVKHGQTSTIDVLLGAGARIDTITSDGYSPIHLAAKGGFLSTLKKLIQWQRRSNEPMAPSSTDQASETSHNNEIKDTGTTNAIDERRYSSQKNPSEEEESQKSHASDPPVTFSPLQLAAQNGNEEIVRELLQYHQYSSDEDRAISLLIAAKEGFVEIVEMLLKSTITINFGDEDGNTALHLAANGEYTDIVERLVSYHSNESEIFDPRAANLEGWTPLHFAAKSGRLVTLQILLDHGAKMDDRNESKQNALHIAASRGHVCILRELLNKPYSGGESRHPVSAPDKSGNTPFILAVRNGHWGAAKRILDSLGGHRFSFYQGKKNALIEAVDPHHCHVVNLLLDYGWDINQNKPATALHHAVKAVDHSLIDLLLNRGADPNVLDCDSQSSIHIAAQQFPAALEELLKDRGQVKIDINLQGVCGRTAIWQATSANNETAVKQLLKLSPNLEVKDTDDCTALHAAYESPRLTKLLLDAGANPMAFSIDHRTPFMLAAGGENGHLVMEHFINRSSECDFSVQDRDGATALHIAVIHGILDTVKLLCSIDGGIAVMMARDDVTALHIAADSGQLSITEYLITEGLDVNSNSDQMGTPIMCAAEQNLVDIVKVLLENGARVDLVNEECCYHSALQAAAANNAESVVQMLLEAGAHPNTFGGYYGSPLCASIRAENIGIARQLLAAGADINYSKGRKGTALEYAIACRKSDLMRFLLEYKADVSIPSNGKHGTALVAAIHKNSFDNVNILLEHGADANLSSSRGEKPAQAALEKGREKIFLMLLGKGAQFAFKDRWGRGPLSIAILRKCFTLLPNLWGHPDVDVNEGDCMGRTPLMLSVLHGIGEMVRELQDHNANIDAQDNSGKTALIYAIIKKSNCMVTDLVTSGAAMGLKDARGRDALYWAAEKPSLYDEILKSMRHRELHSESLQHALNATIALDNQTLAQQLFQFINSHRLEAGGGGWTLRDIKADGDGWTIHDTASRYKNGVLKSLINLADDMISEPLVLLTNSFNSVKIPTQWHPLDLYHPLQVSPDGASLTLPLNYKSPNEYTDPKGIALANHPMWPQHDEVYYFEVKVEHEGDGSRRYAIGFCDERTPLDGVELGWQKTSRGYHGDGTTFHGSRSRSISFGEAYGEGDVIGCGVNFAEEIAFYTVNGEIIGRAFCEIRGKLYPAVSVDVGMGGCKLTAMFWEGETNGNKDFMFKGPFNDKRTLMEPPKRLQRKRTAFKPQQQDTSSDTSDSSSDLDSD